MKQLVYIEKGRLEWREAKDPELQSPYDALVRPFAVARCDLDNAFLNRNLGTLMNAAARAHYLDPRLMLDLGERPFDGPFPYGHECVAEVLSVGSAVTDFKQNDVVVVPFQVSCGSCLSCTMGKTAHCETNRLSPISAYGFGLPTGAWGGAMADVVRVPFANHMLVPIPSNVDPISLASASDNIPDGWRGVAPHLKNRPGSRVLVLGGQARSVSLYAVGIAVALGSEQVDYVDTSEQRLQIAQELGANCILRKPGRTGWKQLKNELTDYPIAFDGCGEKDGLEAAIRALATTGVCTSATPYFRKRTALPLWEMYSRSLRFETGLVDARACLPEIIALTASGLFQPAKVTTLTADWCDAPHALLDEGPKVVVTRPRLSNP